MPRFDPQESLADMRHEFGEHGGKAIDQPFGFARVVARARPLPGNAPLQIIGLSPCVERPVMVTMPMVDVAYGEPRDGTVFGINRAIRGQRGSCSSSRRTWAYSANCWAGNTHSVISR